MLNLLVTSGGVGTIFATATHLIQTVSYTVNVQETGEHAAGHSLVGLGYAVRLDVRVPVLLPAVALPARLALEGLQAHVLVHVLLEIFGFEELLVTAAGRVRRNNNHNQRETLLIC